MAGMPATMDGARFVGRDAAFVRLAPALEAAADGVATTVLLEGPGGVGVSRFVDELAPLPGEVVLDKPGKGSFYATDLELMLRNAGIKSLIVTGVTTEVCVHTTVREANDRGFECLVLSDCCGSYFPEFHEVALRMISAQGGIFGWVGSSSDLLAALPIGARA
jgi:nicotinamidase-related amidase